MPAKVKIQDRKDKTREIEKIFGGFEQYSRETFDGSWGKRDWASAVEDLCGEIRECCDLEDEEFLLRYLARANRILAPLGVPATAELMLCRGSIMMCFITASYYLARVNAAEKIPVMENILRDEMRQMIDRVEEEATVFLRGMEKLRTEQTETPET